jgi:hypothetical protein
MGFSVNCEATGVSSTLDFLFKVTKMVLPTIIAVLFDRRFEGYLLFRNNVIQFSIAGCTLCPVRLY